MQNTTRSLLAALLLVFNLTASAQDTIRIHVNSTQGRKPISPYIYGVNDKYSRATALRLGGNRLTSYNWENNASNAGHDYIHHSDEYVPWQQGVPDSLYARPGAALRAFHDRALAQGAYSLVTLPMAGYVAADMNGTIEEWDAAPSARWKEVRVHKGAPTSLSPDTSDGYVYLDETVDFLLHHYGAAGTPTGVRGYSLDNEPCLWFSTHPRLFGETHVAVDTLLRRSIELAAMIKDKDPAAEVFGPALYGYNAYLDLQQAPGWNQYNGQYDLFVHYYLDEMRRQDSTHGRRLLDVLDLHWYPEYNFTAHSSPFSNANDPATARARMDMPRSLWDSTYTENTWIGNGHAFRILPVLPKLRSMISRYYPGTKLAITEYSYMGLSHASGGIAQADALGIFGREGLYMAYYWGGLEGYIKSGFDLFRNYNGSGGTFADTAVSATTNNIDFSSVYASVGGSDSALHVIALNKDQDAARTFTFTVNSPVAFHGAHVWGFDSDGATLRRYPDVRLVTNNTFTYTLPPMAGLHFELSTEDLSAYPLIETTRLHPPAGYANGSGALFIGTHISDGDNNLASVTVDLSPLGGPAAAPLQQAADSFWVNYTVPAGIASGLKSLLLKAVDADGHSAETILSYRVIAQVPPKKIWDGDLLAGGEGSTFYDPSDPHGSALVVERQTTGGNEEPGALYLHFGHDSWRWCLLCFRFAPDPAHPADISEYQYLEFYVRGNAPAGADIDLSLQDCSAAQHTSNTVRLRADGYLDGLSPTSFTRVRIPLSAFTDGTPFDLTRTWQLNFLSNLADTPFDLWVDDVRAVPFPDPLHMPVIRNLSVTPGKTYGDGQTSLTVSATVTDPDGDLASVAMDLAALNGSNKTVMTNSDSSYTVSFNIPRLPAGGTFNLQLNARDAANNEVTASVPFTLYAFAATDTIWNGDSKPFGAAWVNNDSTTCALAPAGGNHRPGSMQVHLAPDPVNHVNWSAIVWDWNENTFNHNLQNGSDKRSLAFWMKVTGATPGLELELSLKDVNATPSNGLRLVADGYVSSFTGGWQRVQVPLGALCAGSDMDRSRIARFVLVCNAPPAAGVDILLDDITFSGSLVADVRIDPSDAQCGDNGTLGVSSVPATPGSYQYFLDGAARPDGNATGLAPGTYLVKLTGPGDFIYCEEVVINGSRALAAQAVTHGSNVLTQVSNGTGSYSYLWSNGATTASLSGAAPGTYNVLVTDNSSGCTATATAVVASALPLQLVSFGAQPSGNDVRLSWVTLDENVMGFELQHGRDGLHFATLAAVAPGTGAERRYAWTHAAPGAGTHYYRLRWREPDGRWRYAPVRIAHLGGSEPELVLTPNPARHFLDIRVAGALQAVEVLDARGAVQPLPLSGYRADLRGLAPGAYVLRARVDGEWRSARFTRL
ncbi:MAG: hypothetical protein EOO12_05330 [Chitinophagaceae bacterium]|nr:MAG: hypothetical protein EOO12_05330 [Chitinophagaceae bacterium]